MANDPKQQPDPLEKSLGDQATGADVSRTDEERSLGDQSTTGDALSSLSDLGSDLGEAIDSDLPLIDLAARYEIEGELGQGGMGAVLLATDRQLKRKVAIKRILGSMSKSKTALQRFVTEAQSIAKLNHFNIVQVHEFGRDAEGPLLVLEYVGGGSLLDKLKDGKLEVEEAVDITCQLCDGLSVAHEQGVVHRDIKPANILLTERGEPKLTDFGLARQDTADHGQTQAGAVLGTIDFMPPEQRLDATATDARSDLWSLAATLYQMITGETPRVIDLDDAPRQLRRTLSRALKSKQDDRYQTAQDFRDALKDSLATATEAAPEVVVNLGAGECGECHTKNDFSRKFCSECAAPLRVACLKCEKEIPIWDKVCGECGGKQPELATAHRSKLSSILETSLTLSREHEYEKALSQLEIVTEDKHASTEELREQAARQVDLTTAQRDEEYELRDRLVAIANQYQQAHDYGTVVRELKKIPTPLRTGNNIGQQLSNAQAARDELATLESQIRSDVKNRRIEGLLEKTTRFLELNPGHEKIHTLHQQLQQRLQKSIAAALKTNDWEKVLSLEPDNTEALRMKAEAEKAFAISAALEKKDWPRVLELDPGNTEALRFTVWDCRGHTKPVTSVAFSPDGKRIVSGSLESTIRIWDANSGEQLQILEGHISSVTSVAFSPDGKRIVSGSYDKSVMIWDANSGRQLQKLKGYAGCVTSVAFSPDGKRIASGNYDKRVIIWDSNSGRQLQKLKGHADEVYSVSFSPCGNRIASGSRDRTLKIWDAVSGQKLLTLNAHTGWVTSVAFSPDGMRVISGSGDKTVRIWDANSGEELQNLREHTDEVKCVAFSPDGKLIASGSWDKTAIIWDVSSGEELQTLKGHTNPVTSVAFSPDGKQIVSGSSDKRLKAWPTSGFTP